MIIFQGTISLSYVNKMGELMIVKPLFYLINFHIPVKKRPLSPTFSGQLLLSDWRAPSWLESLIQA